jgi:hypothetical protein
VFVRKDLPHGQRVVQASHACIECAKAFLDSNLEHPHLVVIGVNDESKLHKAAIKLDNHGIRYKTFIEPDRNDEATAIATEPIWGEAREIFRNYTLLGNESSNETILQKGEAK